MCKAQNVKAMREWIRQCRPEVARAFDELMEDAASGGHAQGVFGLMCMAFEAGRQHQKYTPDDPELAPIRPRAGA